MSNTITRTTPGLIRLDTLESGSLDAGWESSGLTSTVRTLTRNGDSSNKVLRIDNGGNSYLYEDSISRSEVVVACWQYQNTASASATVAPFASGLSLADPPQTVQIQMQIGAANVNYWVGTLDAQKWEGSPALSTWYYNKGVFKPGDNRHYILDANGDPLPQSSQKAYSGNQTGYAGWRFYNGSTYVDIDNLLICNSNFLTVAGLTSGMIVYILDAATNIILLAAKATGATVTIDLRHHELPLRKLASGVKFQIIGTNGISCLTSAAQTDVVGGDTWTYSGATTGDSGQGIRAYPYIWRYKETDTSKGISGVKCWLKDSNGDRYGGYKKTNRQGVIIWKVFQEDTYSIFTDKDPSSASDTFTISSTQLDSSVMALGSGTGDTEYVWQYTDTDNNPHEDNVYIWATSDAEGTTMVTDRLLPDVGGYVKFNLDAGTYYIWSSIDHDGYVDTITVS